MSSADAISQTHTFNPAITALAVGHRRLIHLSKDIMELLWEISGWAGAVAILGAYLAVSMGRLKAAND